MSDEPEKLMDEEEDGGREALLARDERFVVLIRHGIAEEPTAEKIDADRSLTTEGHAKMKQIARGLAQIFPRVVSIYSSPLVRCVQTGLWLTKGYRKKVTLTTLPALRPDGDPAEVIEVVRNLPDRRLILIGHEPNLSDTMAQWIGMPHVRALELKKGGCYGLRIGPRGTTLEWVLSPRILRRIE